uniref:Tyr recombinase domain-containing protein n=1 Tax=Amphimedon queenslandica TaxID=400682 RepID=A0A1X7T7Z6_AMPQE
GLLLVHQDQTLPSKNTFVRHLKNPLVAKGIDQNQYSGHSFRIGAATSAAKAGIPDHLIKALGRWKLEAYQIYIRAPTSSLAVVSMSI